MFLLGTEVVIRKLINALHTPVMFEADTLISVSENGGRVKDTRFVCF